MKRVLTAALLIPPTIYLIFEAPPMALKAIVALIALLSWQEYRGFLHGFGWRSLGPYGFVAGLAVLLIPHNLGLVLTLLFLLAIALSMSNGDVKKVFPQAAAISFGLIYIFGAWRWGIELRAVSAHWLLFALVVNWVGDSAAYYGGRAFGKHKLAPTLSPGKTWEGTIASAIGAVAFGLIYLIRFMPDFPIWQVIAICISANVAGQVGDLCESAMKRGAGVKDSGSLLPGHGGWLDRLDSSLFSMPVVYLWVLRPWVF
jgi:phosphatidate cytidylyltransferase